MPARRRASLRSGFTSSALALLLSLRASAAAPDLTPLQTKFDAILRASRAEIGVAVMHVESGMHLSAHGDDRFPMASVYKLPIVVELLLQVAEGKQRLDRPMPIAAQDIRACCTLSRRHPKGGVTLTVAELVDLMVVESDNTASDVVLKLVGGPDVVERRMRALGFGNINVNRYEGDINFDMTGVASPPPHEQWTLELQRRLVSEVALPDLWAARLRYMHDPRDTATPDDMAGFLVRLQRGTLLPPAQTQLLLDAMCRAKTGPQRLKSLLPPETPVAHKTGTTNVIINDVGIITLPGDAAMPGHVAIAVFAMNGRTTSMQTAIARLSAATYEFFTGRPLSRVERPKAATKRAKRGKM